MIKDSLLRIALVSASIIFVTAGNAQPKYKEVKRFRAHHAVQGVAVDKKYVYAIQNNHISKFTQDGDSITTWHEPNKEKIRHLNSGIVIGHKLYCAHSNYPKVPMASSIEVFDTRTLQPIESISLGRNIGSCTWIVPGRGCWYVFFAHYDKSGGEPGKDASWAQLVKFDKKWRRQQAWILPKALIEEARPNSLSGGILIDGVFYCTGHGNGKCYMLKLPRYGMTLDWVGTATIPFDGQGIACDRQGNLWGIIRKDRQVLKAVKDGGSTKVNN